MVLRHRGSSPYILTSALKLYSWSFTLREEHRLRNFEDRALRKIFGDKRFEVTRELRRLHNEELNDLYSLTKYCAGDKINRNEMGRACGTYDGQQSYIKGFGVET